MMSFFVNIGTKTLANLKTGFLALIAPIKLLTDQMALLLVANTGYSVTTASAAVAQLGLAQSVGIVTKALLAQAAAWLKTPIGIITAIGVGIWAAVKAFDALIVTAKEQKEITTTLISEYDEVKGKLTELNDELKTTKDRINELDSKKKLTFVEEEELNRLKKQNSELQTRIDLLAKEEEIKNKEVAKSVKKEYEKSYLKNVVNPYEISYDDRGSSSSATTTQEQVIQEHINALNQFNKKKAEGLQLTKEEQKEYDKLIEILTSTGSDYSDFADKYKIDDDIRKGWVEMAELINKVLNPDKYKTNVFNEVFDSSAFSKAKAELLELASKGVLNVADVEKYSKLQQVMDKTGLSAVELTEQIKSLAQAQGKAQTDSLVSSYSALEDNLKSITVAMKDYETINNVVNNKMYLTSEQIGLLIKKYPELEKYIKLTTKGWTLESGAMSIVEDSVISLQKTYIGAQNAISTALSSQMAARIGNLSKELLAVSTVAEAYAKLSETLTDSMGMHYTKTELRTRGFSPEMQESIDFVVNLGRAREVTANAIKELDKITASGLGGTPKETKSSDSGVRPSSPDLLKLDIDRYTELDTAINEVTNSLERLKTAREGMDPESQNEEIVASLEEEIRLNKELAQAYNNKAWEQKKERSDLAAFMSKEGFNVAGGFDATNTVSNYRERLQQLYNEYNALPNKTQPEKDARTLAKRQIDDIENAYKRIISLNGDVYKSENDITKTLGENYKKRKEISSQLANASADRISDLEHELFLLEKHNGSLEDKLGIYNEIKQEAHAEAERLRALDPIRYSEDSSEIQALKKKWWDADNSILDLRLKNSKDYIDKKNFYDNWGADSEIKAWTRVIDWLKNEYPNAIEEIADAERSLLEAQKKQTDEFYQAAIARLNEEMDRIKKLRDADSKYWDDRINSQKESNDEQERSIKLAELEERLANQRREKVKRVWSESAKSWIYTVDNEAIKETQKQISDMQKEDEIRNLERQRDKELEKWDKQLKDIEEIQRRWEEILNDVEKTKQHGLLSSLLGDNWESSIVSSPSIALKAFGDEYAKVNKHFYDSVSNSSSGGKRVDTSNLIPIDFSIDPATFFSSMKIPLANIFEGSIGNILNFLKPSAPTETSNDVNIYGDILLPNVQSPKEFLSGVKSAAIMRGGSGFRVNR